MSGILYLNGVDASTYGFEVIDAPDLLSMGGHTYQTTPVVQRAGVLLGTARASVEPRILTLQGFITGSSLSDAVDKLDTLKAAIGTQPCSVRTAWDTTRQYWGVLVGAGAGPNSSFWSTFLSVDLEFLLFDPFAYATSTTTVNFTTAATDVPLGTASSRGNRSVASTIRITGPATNPILTYRNSDGDPLAVMDFEGYSPLTGDYIEIDLARGLVEKVVSTARLNAMGDLKPGWNFPSLDAQDGNYILEEWPTLEVTTGTGQAVYSKAYR